MRQNCISFSIQDLYKLEYIEKGNELPNLDWFIENILKQPAVDNIYELWVFTYKQIYNMTDHFSYKSFLHELGCVLLNAKLLQNRNSIGFKYGCLTITTYQNNSKPNLLEISVAWPLYSPNPIDRYEHNNERHKV